MKNLLVFVKPKNCIFRQIRQFSLISPLRGDNYAWQINDYGGVEKLQKNEIKFPVIVRPDQVVVRVHAASVNPIDVAISGGYGSTVLNLLRRTESCCTENNSEFPITLGRDFAGTVVNRGQNVDDLCEGDQVWGVLAPHLQGSCANYVLSTRSMVCKKPENLSMVDASSLVYAAMTAWSSLQITGGLAVLGASDRNVLVLGGSGGVGTCAVQMLQAWGAQVTATCSTDAIPLLHTLGVTSTIDYTLPDHHERIKDTGKYDVILDCAGLGTECGKDYLPHLTKNPFAKFITLKSPLLRAIDVNGLVPGALSSLASLVQANFPSDLQPRVAPIRWGFFLPLTFALKEITQLATQSKLKPCIDSVFNFDQTPAAFDKQKAGHTRGKIVVKILD